jgi:D-alanyl-lipoteichoic acid acyltransferase DltB (MBOAT superfamily)
VRSFTRLNYAFLVTFFPQLIAGPITHHFQIMPQIGFPRPDTVGFYTSCASCSTSPR